MDQAGDFEGGEGIGEAVEVVDPGGVLEAEAVLTEQGGLERQALGVGAGQGTEVAEFGFTCPKATAKATQARAWSGCRSTRCSRIRTARGNSRSSFGAMPRFRSWLEESGVWVRASSSHWTRSRTWPRWQRAMAASTGLIRSGHGGSYQPSSGGPRVSEPWRAFLFERICDSLHDHRETPSANAQRIFA